MNKLTDADIVNMFGEVLYFLFFDSPNKEEKLNEKFRELVNKVDQDTLKAFLDSDTNRLVLASESKVTEL